MKPGTRYLHIDCIRAIAILGVMLVHVLAFHTGEALTASIWNFLHFGVTAFVFCSSYIYAASHPGSGAKKDTLLWLYRRVIRLYLPFAVYIGIHYVLLFLTPSLFNGYGLHKDLRFLGDSLLLTGGIDFGWLTLLFIQLALISPFLLSWSRNTRTRTIVLLLLGIGTLVTTFFRIPMAYTRAVAWIPWSLIVTLSFLYSDAAHKRPAAAEKMVTAGLLTGAAIYTVLYGSLAYFGKSLTLWNHKYPPDLFYLSYGIMWASFLIRVLSPLESVMAPVKNTVVFLSKHSYQLFFIHFVILDLVMSRFRSGWIIESIYVIVGSASVLYLSNAVAGLIRKARETRTGDVN